MPHAFALTLRGYDRALVDQLLDQAERGLASGSRPDRQAALDALRSAAFPMRLRGYDRDAVDEVVAGLIRELG